MDLAEFLKAVEGSIRAKFAESAVISHPGDKGENREEILSEFLSKHLPRRYRGDKGTDSYENRRAKPFCRHCDLRRD